MMMNLVMTLMMMLLEGESQHPCLIEAQVSQGVLLLLMMLLLRESQHPCLIEAQVPQGVLLPQRVLCVHNLSDPDHQGGHIC